MSLYVVAVAGGLLFAVIGVALAAYAMFSGGSSPVPSPVPTPAPVPQPVAPEPPHTIPLADDRDDERRTSSGRTYSERDFYTLAKKYPDYLYRAIFEECKQRDDEEMLALAVALYERHFLGEEIAEQWGLKVELTRASHPAPVQVSQTKKVVVAPKEAPQPTEKSDGGEA